MQKEALSFILIKFQHPLEFPFTYEKPINNAQIDQY